ncbi:porin [Sphingomicrobium sediminis]|uniref:Porin n=1 Tax=Sphingomicrobium sediminis TaxID=2950949 RepID=A0A9X2EIT3_9SPHN|nr:porin [Sphingomicrobium sediminis]MCM8558290.1 porin [Sphingomicrobium sediminis]
MIRNTLLGSAALCLALAAQPAFAQEVSAEDLARMQAQLDALQAEVTDLRQQLAEAQSAEVVYEAEMAARESELMSSIAEAKAEAEAANAAVAAAPAIAMKPTPETKAGGFTFKPRGRLQYDVANVSSPNGIDDEGLGWGTTLRRARLGVSGDMPGGFGYKFEVDFADNDVAMTDAIITYEDGPLGVTIGQHNAFWGLEEMTSSNHISFIERAAFTDAFGFSRRVGLSAEYSAGDVKLWGGFFTADLDDLGDDDADDYGMDARVVYLPKVGDTQLHFGGSIHWLDRDDDDLGVRYRQRPNIATTDTRFINTGSFDSDEQLSYGLEFAAIRGPLHVAGETHWLDASRDGFEDASFFGGFAEVGYFLTPGDSRGYKGGKFDRVKPVSPVGEGGFGALQANLRYDHIDLTDGTLIGGSQDAYGASLIWTPMDYIRFIVQYQRLQIENAAIPAAGDDRDYGVDVFGTRAQVEF